MVRMEERKPFVKRGGFKSIEGRGREKSLMWKKSGRDLLYLYKGGPCLDPFFLGVTEYHLL